MPIINKFQKRPSSTLEGPFYLMGNISPKETLGKKLWKWGICYLHRVALQTP
jgi:hypothetical protein